MHVRLIAVGDRQPSWVDEAVDRYAARLPKPWRFRLVTVATARRRKNADTARAVAAEGGNVLQMVRSAEQLVVLDEHGSELTSIGLAEKLYHWQGGGRDLTFVIGGPDGASEDLLTRADFRWSLSRLTLPHGLVRVLFVEQLYRAWTISAGHPYHRE
jgi:23S rRNA (pseudouridine1915-N3)-methyltransferase